MRILIIEDKPLSARELNRYLQKEGFNCKEARNGKTALELIHTQKFDLILLNINLPDYDGMELMKKILTLRINHAIIVISEKGTTEEKIEGLDTGADDFLPKPFSLIELKSRILAVMRRKNNLSGNILRIENIEIDLNSRRVTCNKNNIRLTRTEYNILIYLILNKNKVISRYQLIENIWGGILEQDYNSNFIDVHIKNLRKKMPSHLPENFLETIRGIGFRLNEIKKGP
jgi:DNA-binding response OmpR family regulator